MSPLPRIHTFRPQAHHKKILSPSADLFLPAFFQTVPAFFQTTPDPAAQTSPIVALSVLCLPPVRSSTMALRHNGEPHLLLPALAAVAISFYGWKLSPPAVDDAVFDRHHTIDAVFHADSSVEAYEAAATTTTMMAVPSEHVITVTATAYAVATPPPPPLTTTTLPQRLPTGSPTAFSTAGAMLASYGWASWLSLILLVLGLLEDYRTGGVRNVARQRLLWLGPVIALLPQTIKRRLRRSVVGFLPGLPEPIADPRPSWMRQGAPEASTIVTSLFDRLRTQYTTAWRHLREEMVKSTRTAQELERVRKAHADASSSLEEVTDWAVGWQEESKRLAAHIQDTDVAAKRSRQVLIFVITSLRTLLSIRTKQVTALEHDLEKERDIHEVHSASAARDLSALQSRLDFTAENIDLLQDENERQRSLHKAETARFSHLERDIRRLQDRRRTELARASEEATSLRTELEAAERRRQIAEEEATKLRDTLNAHKPQLETALGWQQRVDDKDTELRNALDEHRKELEAAERRRQTAEDKATELHSNLDDHRKKLEDAERRRQAADDKATELHNTLDAHQKKLKAAEEERAKADKKAIQLQSDLDSNRIELDSRQSQLESANKQQHTAEKKTEEKTEELRAALESHQQTVDSHQPQLDSANEQRQIAEKKTEELRIALDRHQQTLDYRQSQLDSANEQRQLAEKKSEELENELNSRQRLLDTANKQCRVVERKAHELQQRLEAQQHDSSTQQAFPHPTETQQQVAEKWAQELQERLNARDRDLALASEREQAFSSRVDELTAALQAQTHQLGTVEQQKQDAEQRLASVQEEVEILRHSNAFRQEAATADPTASSFEPNVESMSYDFTDADLAEFLATFDDVPQLPAEDTDATMQDEEPAMSPAAFAPTPTEVTLPTSTADERVTAAQEAVAGLQAELTAMTSNHEQALAARDAANARASVLEDTVEMRDKQLADMELHTGGMLQLTMEREEMERKIETLEEAFSKQAEQLTQARNGFSMSGEQLRRQKKKIETLQTELQAANSRLEQPEPPVDKYSVSQSTDRPNLVPLYDDEDEAWFATCDEEFAALDNPEAGPANAPDWVLAKRDVLVPRSRRRREEEGPATSGA